MEAASPKAETPSVLAVEVCSLAGGIRYDRMMSVAQGVDITDDCKSVRL